MAGHARRHRRRGDASPAAVLALALAALVWLGGGEGVALVAAAETTTTPAVGATDNANCALCAGLQHCTALNGKLLFDPVIGYTREQTPQLEKQGVCEDLDATTVALSRFGDKFQFKDTPRCRALVWNFHCLSLAATTHARVIDGVRVSCDRAPAAASASKPLPACRSLCVEVADKCVYSHLYRMYLENVCGSIPCVSEEEEAASNVSLKQAPCVKAPWESVPNTTFSRCSIREYVPPKAVASQHAVSARTLAALVVASVLYYV